MPCQAPFFALGETRVDIGFCKLDSHTGLSVFPESLPFPRTSKIG